MRKTALNMVHELAKKDDRVVYIGSDPGSGTLDEMREEFPDRFFIEGIAEANVIGMAAGMAMEGYVPYVNTIATFLTRRCYEQLAVDLCLHKLPVRLIGNGGGLVYAPLGPTHQAIEDIAIMRALPHMTVIAPADADEMRRMIPQTLNIEGPVYIRLGKGHDDIVTQEAHGNTLGKAILHKEPGDALIITTGIMLQRALKAIEQLTDEGINCGLLHCHTIKPLDTEMLTQMARRARVVITAEEHLTTGGLGGAVLEALSETMPGSMPPVIRKGIPDKFTHHYGSQDMLLEHYGLQGPGLDATVKDALSK